jgi:hypothetical protein
MNADNRSTAGTVNLSFIIFFTKNLLWFKNNDKPTGISTVQEK